MSVLRTLVTTSLTESAHDARLFIVAHAAAVGEPNRERPPGGGWKNHPAIPNFYSK